LFYIAQRVGTPVYELEERMPASELFDWILFLQAEHAGPQPQEVNEGNADAFAAAMGARAE